MITDINPFMDWWGAQQFAETHICANCRHTSALVVRWHDGHEVYCPKCGNDDKFRAIESLTAMWRENPESVPVQIANRLADKHGAGIETVAEGLPPELAAKVRARYPGLQPKRKEKHNAH